MSLRGLIKNQSIIIDDHRRGNGEIKNWNDPTADIHIDKTTNFPLNGKRQNVRIRVPINSEREIKIENGKQQELDEIPKRLRREIFNAFEDKQTRERFVTDLISTLQNFSTILDSEKSVQQILEKLSKHFGLEWTEEKITTYSKDVLKIYTQKYRDDYDRNYYITVDRNKIKIAQDNGFARYKVNKSK